MSNIYHDELSKRSQIDAGKLLNLMRGKVEPILQKYETDRHCKSQSYRATRLRDYLDAEIQDRNKRLGEKREYLQDRRIINDFLAVHRTVWILDGRAI